MTLLAESPTRPRARGITLALAGAVCVWLAAGPPQRRVAAQTTVPTCEADENPVLFNAGQIHAYTFPPGVGSLRIIMAGGSGGDTPESSGGAGAVLELLYEPLAAGEDLAVVAGEAGESLAGDRDSGGGGGGGSFVARGVGAAAFQIANVVGVAGGGGGAGGLQDRDGGAGGDFGGNDGAGGATGGSGGGDETGGQGGTNGFDTGGDGGDAAADGTDGANAGGGGGGGLGGDGGSAGGGGGQAAVNGGNGGAAGAGGGAGGFGGGGGGISIGAETPVGGGGGGGGYTGGGGGGGVAGGGGGGSSELGSAPAAFVSIAATNIGDGFVLFCERAQTIPAAGPIGLVAGALLLIAAAAWRLRASARGPVV